MIGIINYGMGNLGSVQNVLDYLNIPNKIIDNPEDIDNCSKLIIPGVGAFGQAMQRIEELGFSAKLRAWVISSKPLLGICLGMQLFFDTSFEHGEYKGLAFIAGSVRAFRDRIKNLPVPHIGWNNSIKIKDDSLLLSGINNNESFYYVHSFYCDPIDLKFIAAQTDYGFSFTSVIEYGSLYGCQFHPEKSQKAGLKILENFWKLC